MPLVPRGQRKVEAPQATEWRPLGVDKLGHLRPRARRKGRRGLQYQGERALMGWPRDTPASGLLLLVYGDRFGLGSTWPRLAEITNQSQ